MVTLKNGNSVLKINEKGAEMKSFTVNGVESTYEIRVEKSEAFLNKLLSINGVHEASLIAYQSETV